MNRQELQDVKLFDAPAYGTKEYYEWAYQKRGVQKMYLRDYAAISKAVAPADPPASPYDAYFDPVFSSEIEQYVMRDSVLYKLLRKRTFQEYGDSMKFWETDIAATTAIAASDTPFASLSTESGPDITGVEQFRPAYLFTKWKISMMSEVESSWQRYPPGATEAFLKKYFQDIVPNDYDIMLLEDVDTPNTAATRIESLDRIISNGTESGDGTTYVSAVTDGDIYWGKASAIADRSETTAAWTDAQVDLPATAAARTLDMGKVDDVLADALDYAKNDPFYIMLTGRRTLNEICDYYDDKQWFAEAPMNVKYTLNGVSTPSGGEYGISVASIISNGLQIPIFTSKHICGENSLNQTSKITDNDVGHIYLINMDDIHLRVAMPPAYFKTSPSDRLAMDSFYDRHGILSAMQLIATNFKTQAAVKYLKAA